MWLLSIDDFVLADYGIAPAMITNRSSHLGFGVDRRAGVNTSVFFGAQSQPASWNVIIQCPTEAARFALIQVLAAPQNEQFYLVADRALPADPDDLVTTWGAVTSVEAHGSSDNLEVTFESNDSIWIARTATTTSKTFTSPIDQMLHIPVSGNIQTFPIVRITPTVQRTTFTANVGWTFRRRWQVGNFSDETLFRYPLQISLGNTATLVSGGKALANGNDLRVWLDGIEQSRTVIGWNTASTFLWVVIPSLAVGQSLIYEVVYGNPSAGAPPVLAYPDLPAFDLAASTNSTRVYRAQVTGAFPAQGLWYISSPSGAYFADFSVPGAWYRTLVFADEFAATAPSTEQQAAPMDFTNVRSAHLHVTRAAGADTPLEGIDSKDVYDTIALSDPLGITSITVGFRYLAWTYTLESQSVTTTIGATSTTSAVDVREYHDPGMFRIAVGARHSSAETWAEVATYDHTTQIPTVPTAWAAAFGSLGTGNGQFSPGPDQVAIGPDGNIWVADPGNHRYQRFTSAGVFSLAQTASLFSPLQRGVCVDSSNNVYLAAFVDPSFGIEKRSPANAFVWDSTVTPSGVAMVHLATDDVYVYATSSDHQVRRYNVSDGAFWSSWGALGSGPNQLNTPMGIACGNGYVYVVDQANDRIQVFNTNGVLITSWGSPGTGNGQFITAYGIAVNPVNGHVLVSDQGRDDVQEFTIFGDFIQKFGTTGTGSGQFTDATGLAFIPDGTSVWVGDPANVQRFTIPLNSGDTEFRYEIIALTPYAINAKHVALGVWPQVRGLLPTPDPQGYMDVLNEGDITVGIVSGSIAVAVLQNESAIYELATELRIGGGGTAPVGTYHTLLIGNARGASGAGTPRAAVLFPSQTLQLDCEAHDHGIWNTAFTVKAEDMPTHAVRALEGYLHDGVTGEIPTAEWLPLAPARRTVPNGDFATTINNWQLESTGSGITQSTVWDGTIGGLALGSLRIGITANTAANSVLYRTTGFFAVNGAESVSVSCWCRTSNANIQPQLAIFWYQEVSATSIGNSMSPAWAANPVANIPYEIAFSAAVPPSATRFRIMVEADVIVSAAIGNVWFDDVRLNDSDLVIEDDAMGTLAVSTVVSPRWIP